ncbi:hypothetical protein [Streptomyces sp. NPDC001717]|uniref:hypothetical protein n=1 Tax=Streptomyces sp. NPDC001717 TaxID=3364604 RepID=UPI0036BDBC0F
MTTQPDMLQIALQGFHTARVRYYKQLDGGHPEEQLIVPTIEVIYWACVLDEQLEKRDPTYTQSMDYGREVMQGARFSRNRATHELLMLIKRTAGLQVPVRVPLRLEEIVWLSVDPPQGEERTQRWYYVRHLADKPVRHTIDTIAAWFAEVQNRPHSPLRAGLQPSEASAP